jgi:signal transduction histidine kinase
MSLRWRLALLYTAILWVIGLLVGVAVLLAVRAGLYQVLDQSLLQAANDFARPFNTGREINLTLRPGNKPPDAAFFSTFDRQGRAISLDFSPVKPIFQIGVRSLEGYRVAMVQAKNGYWIQAARLETDTQKTLQSIAGLMLWGIPLLTTLGLGAGYVFVGRVLAPIDEVSSLAKQIAKSGDVKARVPVVLGRDELARLTQTVNAMLERVETAFVQQQAFALAAAHELRTPLTKLLARIHLMLEQPRHASQDQEALLHLEQSAQGMRRLVQHLLGFAQPDQAPQSVVDLADLCLELSEAAAESLQAKQQHLELSLQSVQVLGNPETLRLAIDNLLRNAIAYSPPGATIWVTTSSQLQAHLEIADNGAGLSQAELERVRRPFERGLGLQNQTGSGLGLALVAQVVVQHGGTFELQSAKQGGLSARISLQLMHSDAAQSGLQ